MQVMQLAQIVLSKFRFTELGSKSAIVLKHNMHNVYKCQKEYVPAFLKYNMAKYPVSFLLSVGIFMVSLLCIEYFVQCNK